jgi:hypothetical protein
MLSAPRFVVGTRPRDLSMFNGKLLKVGSYCNKYEQDFHFIPRIIIEFSKLQKGKTGNGNATTYSLALETYIFRDNCSPQAETIKWTHNDLLPSI